ncbi:hypothetical protein P9112_000788 [Eukaryota sp. TZLM1-RC]
MSSPKITALFHGFPKDSSGRVSKQTIKNWLSDNHLNDNAVHYVLSNIPSDRISLQQFESTVHEVANQTTRPLSTPVSQQSFHLNEKTEVSDDPSTSDRFSISDSIDSEHKSSPSPSVDSFTPIINGSRKTKPKHQQEIVSTNTQLTKKLDDLVSVLDQRDYHNDSLINRIAHLEREISQIKQFMCGVFITVLVVLVVLIRNINVVNLA